MSIYIPEYICLTHNLCHSHDPASVPLTVAGVFPPVGVIAPYAPYMYAAPLPSPTLTLVEPTIHGPNTFYPIGIMSNILIQKVELETIILTCPIHIHTPQAHIGTVHGLSPGQSISALDLFRFLRTIAAGQLAAHAMYSQLPQQVKARIKAAFIRRNGLSSSTLMLWEAFRSGQPTRGGPTGEDLLLGNVNIWGLEERSIGGFSVVHLA